MKRRSKAGGEPIKGRRRKTPGPKRRNAPKAAPRVHRFVPVAATRASALMVVKSTDSTVANPASVAIAPPAMTTAQNDPRFLRTFVTTVLMASSDAFRRSGVYSHALIKNVIRDTQLRIPAL
jgi:hypothetical protein